MDRNGSTVVVVYKVHCLHHLPQHSGQVLIDRDPLPLEPHRKALRHIHPTGADPKLLLLLLNNAALQEGRS